MHGPLNVKQPHISRISKKYEHRDTCNLQCSRLLRLSSETYEYISDDSAVKNYYRVGVRLYTPVTLFVTLTSPSVFFQSQFNNAHFPVRRRAYL